MIPAAVRRSGLALLVACLLGSVLTGCGGSSAKLGSPHVDVDTPALRALKAQAHIAPCEAATASVATGSKALPDVTLPCLGGGTGVAMARLRGPLVINLWAQWCGPCRKELPYYQAFFTKYAGKVGVLGVDWMESQPDAALQLAKATGATYPQVADLEPSIRAIGNGLPQLILLDANGTVVYQAGGGLNSLRQLEGLVRQHLGVS